VALRIALLAVLLSSVSFTVSACASPSDGTSLATALSDDEFWRLSTTLSEPAGAFKHSDNLVSNELLFAHTIQLLRPRGGVYIGVGPEQNFSFIARLEPVLAFIIDIRQENRLLHLLYKALFEASADRADFVSRLFSRDRPGGLDRDTSVDDLFSAYAAVRPSPALQAATARLVRERLLDARRVPLSNDDLAAVDGILAAFYADGPDIHYGRLLPPTAAGPSYRALMTARDVRGQSRSYLATEEAFAFVKALHTRNLIVPVVGDFSGPTAIRRVGDYIRERGGTVSAFYGSNVQVYLTNQQLAAFCGNLATLPYDSRTWFIMNKGHQRFTVKLEACRPGSANSRR
jgi:hypothetical protein